MSRSVAVNARRNDVGLHVETAVAAWHQMLGSALESQW
jgi:hypothetical protein